MQVIPAIDIRGGKCVRLFQGDYEKETVYADDPVETARRWVNEGATNLHVIDLDGAKDGIASNTTHIQNICRRTEAKLQVGGGIRSLEIANHYKELGVSRLILGTTAVESPEIISSIIDIHGSESVIISVDAKDGFVALDGWTRGSEVTVKDLIRSMTEYGVVRCMYTDITRDGTLTEPNFQSIEDIVNETDMKIIAAGGISTVKSIKHLDELGVEAAIVGKAIYTGDLSLREALNAVE